MSDMYTFGTGIPMAEFFEYNKDTGMLYETEEDHEKITISSKQDVEPILDYMKERRGKKDGGIKRGFWHYCSIPVAVEIELRNKGIDIYNKHQTKEVLREINTNYPHLKATRRMHE